VVQEEIGGAGTLYWVEHLDYEVALVILGEPSDNELALGHRGIRQLWVQFNGRSAHASTPQEGDNPNYALGEFLHALAAEREALRAHELLGPTTVSPTIIEVDTKSANVTPAWTRVLLDFRTASESLNGLRAFVHRLAGEGTVQITSAWELDDADPDAVISGFYTPPQSDAATRIRELLATGMGREPALTSYNFATDGRHVVPYQIPVVGYAPGEEEQAHVAGERIAIAKMSEGLRGYVQILRRF
jgi:acetylornithine deacetylase/succinyl-diaminopimelate desuccinylase-like protein